MALQAGSRLVSFWHEIDAEVVRDVVIQFDASIGAPTIGELAEAIRAGLPIDHPVTTLSPKGWRHKLDKFGYAVIRCTTESVRGHQFRAAPHGYDDGLFRLCPWTTQPGSSRKPKPSVASQPHSLE